MSVKDKKTQVAKKPSHANDAVTVTALEAADGVEHINVSGSGHTRLGELLALDTVSEFEHEIYGKFDSVAGFWYWVKARERFEHAPIADKLRKLSGDMARDFSHRYIHGVQIDNFFQEIVQACYYKIVQNPELKKLMIESTLPFMSYYYFGIRRQPIHEIKKEWLLKGLEEIRQYLKGNQSTPFKSKI